MRLFGFRRKEQAAGLPPKLYFFVQVLLAHAEFGGKAGNAHESRKPAVDKLFGSADIIRAERAPAKGAVILHLRPCSGKACSRVRVLPNT